MTNLGQFGYAADTQTSPSNLFAFQAHLGHLAATGSPRGWVRGGDITPIRRYAEMFAGWGLKAVDDVAWYHPMRPTLDARAVADGNRNPAQPVFGIGRRTARSCRRRCGSTRSGRSGARPFSTTPGP